MVTQMRPRRYAIYMYRECDQYPADNESVQRMRVQRSTGKNSHHE